MSLTIPAGDGSTTVSANVGGGANGGILYVNVKGNDGYCGICLMRSQGNHQMISSSNLPNVLGFEHPTGATNNLVVYAGNYGIQFRNFGNVSYTLELMYLPFDL